MRVIWQVEDGYVDGGRPQETEIDDEELEGLSEKDREKLIYKYIQDDFNQNISWAITGYED